VFSSRVARAFPAAAHSPALVGAQKLG